MTNHHPTSKEQKALKKALKNSVKLVDDHHPDCPARRCQRAVMVDLTEQTEGVNFEQGSASTP